MIITTESIHAAHPLETKRHDLYAEAMELVGARHDKGDLVDLVNFLLYRNDQLTEALLPFANAAASLGLPRAKVDPNDFWVSIGVAGSKWRTAVNVLK